MVIGYLMVGTVHELEEKKRGRALKIGCNSFKYWITIVKMKILMKEQTSRWISARNAAAREIVKIARKKRFALDMGLCIT